MSVMKFLYAICIFYTIGLLNSSLVFAQPEACSFSNYEIEGIEIGQISGRQIYTLFTSHLTNEDNEYFEIMKSHRFSEDAVGTLNQLINKHQETIQSEQADAQKILELLKSGQIDWIGIEALNSYTSYSNMTDNNYLNDQNLLQIDSLYSRHRSALTRRFNHLPEWNANKTDQLLSLIYHASTIVRVNHPEIFRRVRVYPLEDKDQEDNESTSHLDNLLYWAGVLERDTHITPFQHSGIALFITNHFSPKPRLISRNVFKALFDGLRIDINNIGYLDMLRVAHNNLVSSILSRDATAVQSILQLPGNGLILFGTDHAHGIKQGLIEACQNGNGSP